MKVKLLSRVQLVAAPWTAAYQAPLSRQEYWSGVPLPSPSPLLSAFNASYNKKTDLGRQCAGSQLDMKYWTHSFTEHSPLSPTSPTVPSPVGPAIHVSVHTCAV